MHGMLWLNGCAFANAADGECTLIAFSTDDDALMQKKPRRNESRTFVEPEPKCSSLCAHFIATAIFCLRACVLVWLTLEQRSFGGSEHCVIASSFFQMRSEKNMKMHTRSMARRFMGKLAQTIATSFSAPLQIESNHVHEGIIPIWMEFPHFPEID